MNKKIGIKNIETRNKHFEDFDVYECNCDVNDIIWFDDGIPDEDGNVTCHDYLKGVVTKVEPDSWWIYDNGEKELGYVSVKCISEDSYYNSHNFSVAFKDIIYEEPIEEENNEHENKQITYQVTDDDLDFIITTALEKTGISKDKQAEIFAYIIEHGYFLQENNICV